eukprot:4532225-Pyramimonas_sp.AAC.1
MLSCIPYQKKEATKNKKRQHTGCPCTEGAKHCVLLLLPSYREKETERIRRRRMRRRKRKCV